MHVDGGLQVNYKNVMKQYNLGPNGGILTSLNLFATRFDQVRGALTMQYPARPALNEDQPQNMPRMLKGSHA